MIGVDTNILVRYLVQDDEAQAEAASRFIETTLSAQCPGFINVIVLCELVWVLEDRYGYSRRQIAPVIKKILASEELVIEARPLVVKTVEAYRAGAADFADGLIGWINRDAGCDSTVTFDKKAARFPTHRLL